MKLIGIEFGGWKEKNKETYYSIFFSFNLNEEITDINLNALIPREDPMNNLGYLSSEIDIEEQSCHTNLADFTVYPNILIEIHNLIQIFGARKNKSFSHTKIKHKCLHYRINKLFDSILVYFLSLRVYFKQCCSYIK